MPPRSIAVSLALLGLLMAAQAAASISLNATRIVFDGDHKEANITVRNGNQDVLIQSWVDMNDASASRESCTLNHRADELVFVTHTVPS